MRKFDGFTLAEVLITLGIIGVVAALTLPALVQNYRNQVVETRLKKVYSVMNQAIVQSEVDNGAKELWDFDDPDFFNKYINPYIKYLKTEIIKSSRYDYLCIYFGDGSMLMTKISNYKNDDGTIKSGYGANQDYFFYPNAKNFDSEKIESRAMSGTSMFEFRFSPKLIPNKEINPHVGKGFEPYLNGLTLPIDEAKLRDGAIWSCKKGNVYPLFCTAIIARNNWKIPKDYPFKVK